MVAEGEQDGASETVQARFTSKLVAAVPIHVADGDDWLLRCARVEAMEGWVVVFDEHGLPDLRDCVDENGYDWSTYTGPVAPASRFVDSDADVQWDPATFPENRRLLQEIDENADRGDAR